MKPFLHNRPTGGQFSIRVPGGQSACPEGLRMAEILGNLILPGVFSGQNSGADTSLESSVGAGVQPVAFWPRENKRLEGEMCKFDFKVRNSKLRGKQKTFSV